MQQAREYPVAPTLSFFTAGFAGAVAFIVGIYLFFDGAYLLVQGIGFLRTTGSAVSIQRLMDRGEADQQTAAFFERLAGIRRYAADSIGLNQTKSYTTYAAVDRHYLVDVVSAVRDDSFERATWRYPVLGRLFYRGFYDPSAAAREAERLRRDGYDVLVRQVNAFSTLGFMADPVYSFMREYEEYRLANLIFHEAMHATVWAHGQNAFNEEIATFVGDAGAARYILEKYGAESEAYAAVLDAAADRGTFRNLIRGVYAELTAAYASLTVREERLAAKAAIFARTQFEFAQRYDERFRTPRYRGFSEIALSNAYIDAQIAYAEDLQFYYRLLSHFGGDLRATVDAIRAAAVARPDAPRAYLAEIVP